MAKRTEIDIEILENGEVVCTVHGIKGKGCLKYEELIASILGQVKQRKLTSEYYEEEGHIRTDIQGKVTR